MHKDFSGSGVLTPPPLKAHPHPPPSPPTAAGLYAEVFYNYPFPSQPDPIPASLKPDYVTSAIIIEFFEGSSDTVGIQLLAKADVNFAVRFSGAYCNPDLPNNPDSPVFQDRGSKSAAMVCGQGRRSCRECASPRAR